MNQYSRRFRIGPTPERQWEIEFARCDPRWPKLDVIDPPQWLADTSGKIITREFFNGVQSTLEREGYKFNHSLKAMVRVDSVGASVQRPAEVNGRGDTIAPNHPSDFSDGFGV